MAQPELTPQLALLEEAKIVLLCHMDDTYDRFNPKGCHYETFKELWNSDITTVVFLQQLRGTNGKSRGNVCEAGTVEARTSQPNDRGVGEDGNRSSFKSVTLPHYMCRFAKVTEVLPPLYLHDLSSGDFVLGLEQSFGNAAGLSAATISRLTERCFPERVMLWLSNGPLRTWTYLIFGRL
jgi:hypothetical protein